MHIHVKHDHIWKKGTCRTYDIYLPWFIIEKYQTTPTQIRKNNPCFQVISTKQPLHKSIPNTIILKQGVEHYSIYGTYTQVQLWSSWVRLEFVSVEGLYPSATMKFWLWRYIMGLHGSRRRRGSLRYWQ